MIIPYCLINITLFCWFFHTLFKFTLTYISFLRYLLLQVDLPDLVTRRDIMAVTLAGNRLGPDVNLTRVAEALEGYTGSDIKEVGNISVMV